MSMAPELGGASPAVSTENRGAPSPAAAAGVSAGSNSPAPEPAQDRPWTPVEQTMVEAQIVEQLHTCYDPEIPIDIYELGLIYEIQVSPEHVVAVRMTLTAPNCPGADSLPSEVYEKVLSVPGVKTCIVDVVWEPPWTPARMSDAAKLALGFL
jgi:FeS assembly SUF system protein